MKVYFTLLTFAVLSFHTYSQQKELHKANKKYDQFAYVEAGELYTKFVDKGYKSALAYTRLGDIYYLNGNMPEALKWYTLMHGMQNETAIDPVHLFRYGQCLRAAGDYDAAAGVLESVNKHCIGAACDSLNTMTNLEAIEKLSGRYTLRPVSLNSGSSDYGVAFYKDRAVIYTSARAVDATAQIDRWSNKPFFKLFNATIADNGDLIASKILEKTDQSKYHESTPAFTRDGKTMYFTRSGRRYNKKRRDTEKTNQLKIYRATINAEGLWDSLQELPFNSTSFSNAHPTLSKDEKTLIFASDRPGSLGLTDLYRVAINDDGTFGEVVSLGNEINTPGRESFPYVGPDGTLYFSSDGHAGLGGLDVYEARVDSDGVFAILNMGKPINSTQDDFTFVMDPENNQGYVASNRFGNDAVFTVFPVDQEAISTNEMILFGTLQDHDQKLITGVTKITAYDEEGNLVDEFYTDANGEYLVKLPRGRYMLRYENPGFLISKLVVGNTSADDNQMVRLNVELEPDPNYERNLKAVAKNEVKDSDGNHPFVKGFIHREKNVTGISTDENGHDLALAGENVPEDTAGGLNEEEGSKESKESNGSNRNSSSKGNQDGTNNSDSSNEYEGTLTDNEFNIDPVYFEFDKSRITKEAFVQLDNVIRILKNNPRLSLDIRSYTDSRGRSSYNDALSERRTSSVMNYILEHGIDYDRVSGRGYGEQHTVNQCTDDVPCAESDHALNRRSEFIFIGHKK